ncbi:MAG TPA: 6-phosphofructokinase [Dictyoglomaceae bacterium]|nr:6-phosphofructokinase [Dictyoglomaceae bacterium]HOL39619.1 6-phosphofructokinase [Dictyoglomaceae bacterium]HOP95159.1 6-phosphofructokinase [Dictyoglomaceae bacterium]HPP15191.1 6-phosphofructokinase [Dictyoglomaceae bacterium]HPU42597.1 6-phosphofructokinase [Dictyoglomaceae bacterium]
MKKIGILTSGGDAPGMNSAIRAIVRYAISQDVEVVGIERGYEGLMEGEFIELHRDSVSEIVQKGGTILLTARSDKFIKEEGKKRAIEILQEENIEGLIVIGGEGSLRGAFDLCKEGIPVIGIPGSIDNDIWGTDFSIGFDTACNNVVDAINKIRDTAASHERTFVVEVMGRECGYIAFTSGLVSGADIILIPEVPIDFPYIIEKLKERQKRKKTHNIIIVSEGVGSAYFIGKQIEDRLDMSTRIVILGHIQRGGSPSVLDRTIATFMGVEAVKRLLSKESEIMIGWQNNCPTPVSLEEVIKNKKRVPVELYHEVESLW